MFLKLPKWYHPEVSDMGAFEVDISYLERHTTSGCLPAKQSKVLSLSCHHQGSPQENVGL